MLSTARKLYAILPPGDGKKLLGLLVLMLVGSLLEVVGVGVIPLFVVVLQDPDRLFAIEFLAPVWQVTGISTARDTLIWGSVFLIVVFLVKNLYIVFLNYLRSRYVYRRFGYLATRLFEAYMRAPYTFHLQRNTAELIRNVTNESKEVTKNVLRGLLNIFMEVAVVLGILALLLGEEPLITLVTMGVLGGLGGLFLVLIKGRLQHHGERAVEKRAQTIQAVSEGIGGFKDAAVLNRQHWFIRTFEEFLRPLTDAMTFREVTDKSTKPVIETVAVTGMISIALLLLWQGRDLATIIPVLTLFGAATVRLMPALRSLISEYNNVRFNVYAVNPVYEDLMALKGEEARGAVDPGTQERLELSSEIRLAGVTFRYPQGARDAVRDVSLSIRRGEAVGFVGPSGAGKTTLVDLVLGLLDPSEGRIEVDGRDIRERMSDWQRNIGYVPQLIYLMDTSIRRNIALGLPDDEIDEGALWDAVRAAQIEEFVQDLPRGLDTPVGEQGVQFSGGQRQRIGIARALYHRPQVLVMDEATSSLDNRTETVVMEAIESLKGRRTILIIAHRISTVETCDRIAVLDDGELVRVGASAEILESVSGLPGLSASAP